MDNTGHGGIWMSHLWNVNCFWWGSILLFYIDIISDSTPKEKKK
jgi:hypothetical protein